MRFGRLGGSEQHGGSARGLYAESILVRLPLEDDDRIFAVHDHEGGLRIDDDGRP